MSSLYLFQAMNEDGSKRVDATPRLITTRELILLKVLEKQGIPRTVAGDIILNYTSSLEEAIVSRLNGLAPNEEGVLGCLHDINRFGSISAQSVVTFTDGRWVAIFSGEANEEEEHFCPPDSWHTPREEPCEVYGCYRRTDFWVQLGPWVPGAVLGYGIILKVAADDSDPEQNMDPGSITNVFRW